MRPVARTSASSASAVSGSSVSGSSGVGAKGHQPLHHRTIRGMGLSGDGKAAMQTGTKPRQIACTRNAFGSAAQIIPKPRSC